MPGSDNLQVCWECPSNIALVKYWGKRSGQLPLNPSLSFSLKRSLTRTKISLLPKSSRKVEFWFKGTSSAFGERVEQYLDVVTPEMPWISDYSFKVESENTFPHSAGIASSASAFGALALCLADLDRYFSEKAADARLFFRQASRLARLGSGSACRSVFPGFAWWGKSLILSGSSDEYAIPVTKRVFPDYYRLKDAILLINSGEKSVPSTAGHALMTNHPYKEGRIKQANILAAELLQVITTNEYARFFELVEQDAFNLHALMMSSSFSYSLLEPESLQVIKKIRTFREQTQLPVGFTIDAGPNIHLLYFEAHEQEVHQFIESELLPFMENGSWIDDGIGDGPVKIRNT